MIFILGGGISLVFGIQSGLIDRARVGGGYGIYGRNSESSKGIWWGELGFGW